MNQVQVRTSEIRRAAMKASCGFAEIGILESEGDSGCGMMWECGDSREDDVHVVTVMS